VEKEWSEAEIGRESIQTKVPRLGKQFGKSQGVGPREKGMYRQTDNKSLLRISDFWSRCKSGEPKVKKGEGAVIQLKAGRTVSTVDR